MSIMTQQEAARFYEQLISQEGLRLCAYLDGVGVLSIGIGHNCADAPVRGVKAVGDSVSLSRAVNLFDTDLGLSTSKLDRALPWAQGLAAARLAVLYNMTFNMGLGSSGSGKGLLGFKRMLAAAEGGRFADAAAEMLNSKWAVQVGRRANKLAQQMSTGEWQPL